MPLKKLFNKFSSYFSVEDNMTNNTSSQPEGGDSAESLNETAIEKLKAIIQEVTTEFPLFERAGFVVEEVQVEIGAVPKLMPRFKITRELSSQEQEDFLQEVADKKLIKFMLLSLFKASRMKNLIQDPGLEFCAIEIDLAAMPVVRGIYRLPPKSANIIRISP